MLQTLLTPAGERLSGTPWPDYPRPQFRRAGWMNLNGLWEFAVTDGGKLPTEFPREILVPFCPECTLSGIGAHYGEGQTLWYRRRFTLPEGFAKDRVVLHIGAADQLLGAWCSGAWGRHAVLAASLLLFAAFLLMFRRKNTCGGGESGIK